MGAESSCCCCSRKRRKIVVVGASGSGATTVASAMRQETDPLYTAAVLGKVLPSVAMDALPPFIYEGVRFSVIDAGPCMPRPIDVARPRSGSSQASALPTSMLGLPSGATSGASASTSHHGGHGQAAVGSGYLSSSSSRGIVTTISPELAPLLDDADGIVVVVDSTAGLDEQRVPDLLRLCSTSVAPLYILLNKQDLRRATLTASSVAHSLHLSTRRCPWVVQPCVAKSPRFMGSRILEFFIDPVQYSVTPLHLTRAATGTSAHAATVGGGGPIGASGSSHHAASATPPSRIDISSIDDESFGRAARGTDRPMVMSPMASPSSRGVDDMSLVPPSCSTPSGGGSVFRPSLASASSTSHGSSRSRVLLVAAPVPPSTRMATPPASSAIAEATSYTPLVPVTSASEEV